MATKQLSKGGGEVQEMAREIAREEQYWILADRSEPRKPPKDYNYVEELAHLQIELIEMQECVRQNRLRVIAQVAVCVFKLGKGGGGLRG